MRERRAGAKTLDLTPDQLQQAKRERYAGRDPFQVTTLARKHTLASMHKVIDIMNGKAGKMKVVVGESIVEVDIEVPATVQLKAAELILERGWGKSPQAILLQTDGLLPASAAELTIMEKIAAIKAARDSAGSVTDLEASELQEVPGSTVLELAEGRPAPEDTTGIIGDPKGTKITHISEQRAEDYQRRSELGAAPAEGIMDCV